MVQCLSLFGTTVPPWTSRIFQLATFVNQRLVSMGGSQFMDYDNPQCTLGRTKKHITNSQLDYWNFWNSEKLKHAEVVFRYCTCSYVHVRKPAFFKGCSCVLHIIYIHRYTYTYRIIHIYIYDVPCRTASPGHGNHRYSSLSAGNSTWPSIGWAMETQWWSMTVGELCYGYRKFMENNGNHLPMPEVIEIIWNYLKVIWKRWSSYVEIPKS